jgi:putative transposase
MSDNGPQLRAGTTGSSSPCARSWPTFERPGTPTDQSWIETLFGHVKTDWPHLKKIRDSAVLAAALERVRAA